jgi:hypothetical protein
MELKAENEALREQFKSFQNKTSSKEGIFDPFDAEILHSDVHDLIKQHFSGKDLLKISEVSPVWCDMVETKIVDKVKLRCVNRHYEVDKEKIYEQILKSNREYKEMEILWLELPITSEVLEES